MSKPVRVMDTEYLVGNCPVCSTSMLGTLTVEVHLGSLSTEVTGREEVRAKVGVQTRLRNFSLKHECLWPRTAETEEEAATETTEETIEEAAEEPEGES